MRQCGILDTTETQRHRESRLTKSLMPLSLCLCVSVVPISQRSGSYFFGGILSRSDNIATCGIPRDIVLASSDCCACSWSSPIPIVCAFPWRGHAYRKRSASVRCVAGATVGAMNTAAQVGSFVSSLMFGYLVDHYGNYDAPFIPMAGLLLIGAWLWVKVNPAKQLVSEAKVVIQTAAQHAHV
jgi:predicted MFS family arabinose efflux permease